MGVLQVTLLKAEEKSDRYKEQTSQVAAELETIKRQLLENTAQLASSNETNEKHASAIEDILQTLQDAEKSVESNQRETNEKHASEIEDILQTLQDAETTVESNQRETNEKHAPEIEDLLQTLHGAEKSVESNQRDYESNWEQTDKTSCSARFCSSSSVAQNPVD